jgi:hypothetical protein
VLSFKEFFNILLALTWIEGKEICGGKKFCRCGAGVVFVNDWK